MRCLIIGCGCRGRLLLGALGAQGYAVRATTRDPERLSVIEEAGAEALVGDPDRVATLIGALDHVGVLSILLGSATGSPEQLRALHGTRLDMLLTKLIDTTVRGVVYEAVGTVPAEVLDGGVQRVRAFGERSHARTVMLDGDPLGGRDWVAAAVQAVNRAAGTV